ncbi:UbiA family prenyltransferase [Qaidamihabitans albus]|uniref:UbiA family prenyltransferase n=1 Tax=Qaidamihabitans albus TaxID=2795733 RepID=UPI0018F230B1|nr:UbiA family prenyltransferase [Qaidamihabitans albus]
MLRRYVLEPQLTDEARTFLLNAGPPPWRHPARRSCFEIYLSWRFIRANFPASVLVTLITVVSAWHIAESSWRELPLVLTVAAIHGWLFIYVHELPNQALGADEDRMNKPHRPIPSGRCTVAGAQQRAIVVACLFVVFSAFIEVLHWAALWLITILLYHFAGGHRSWPTKTLMPMIGAAALIASAWIIGAGRVDSIGWTWIAASFLYWAGVGTLQDQRDIAGDKLLGRRTLPMVIGDRANRIAGAAFLTALPVTLVVPLGLWAQQTAAVVAVQATFTAMCWGLGARLLWRRSKADNDLTYKLYAASYCFLAAGPLLL